MILDPERAEAIRGVQDLLTADLTAAGHLPEGRGLSMLGEELQTSDDEGAPMELSPAAQAFVLGWSPPEPPEPPDFGEEAQPDDQLADAVAQLRAYLALASPTAAQSTAALKLAIRGLFLLLRRMEG